LPGPPCSTPNCSPLAAFSSAKSPRARIKPLSQFPAELWFLLVIFRMNNSSREESASCHASSWSFCCPESTLFLENSFSFRLQFSSDYFHFYILSLRASAKQLGDAPRPAL